MDATITTQSNQYDEIQISPQERIEMSAGMEQNACYDKPEGWTSEFKLGSSRTKPQSKKHLVCTACVMTALIVYSVLCTAAMVYGFTEIIQLKSVMSTLEADTANLKSETATSLLQVMSTRPDILSELEEIKVKRVDFRVKD